MEQVRLAKNPKPALLGTEQVFKAIYQQPIRGNIS